MDILWEYMHNQKAHHDLGRGAILHELIETWHFASTKNDDYLFSSTAAVLALVLKTISTKFDFRPHCSLICENILAQDQVQLLAKGLSASKEHTISPCLRLLTEIASFDGGAFGRRLYEQRDATLDSTTITRNLSLRRTAPRSEDAKPRPSVRHNTVRYLLANLRLQNAAVQTYIITQGPIMKALFEGLSSDPPSLISDVIRVFGTHVAQNPDIPGKEKSQVFRARNLTLIYELRRVVLPDDSGSKDGLHDALHEFILRLCTSPESGVLRQRTGWYPTMPSDGGQAPNLTRVHTDYAGAHDSLDLAELREQIRYSTLAEFAHSSLRPLSDQKDQDLLLAIFKASPELVVDYWLRSTNFTFEPKLSSTWIGYASLLFSSIDLPVPEYFGSKDGYASHPPNSLIAIENIVPTPLNSKVLTKCLHHSSPLVNFFALQMLTIALQKLKRVLSMYDVAHRNALSKKWSEGKEALTALITRRLPGLNEVIIVFRKTPSGNRLQYEVVTRLIALYYELLPHVAFHEKLDVSTSMTEALQTTQKLQEGGRSSQLQLLALAHLIRIAQSSMTISWWKKTHSLEFSPFLTILLAYARSETNALKDIEGLLKSITREYALLQCHTDESAVGVLARSLMDGANMVSNGALAFIDDCLQRYVKRPIAYLDDFDRLVSSHNLTVSELKPVSLLVFTVSEQWSFVGTHRREFSQEIARWISTFFASLLRIGEDFDVLDALRLQMMLSDDRNELSMDFVDQKISQLTRGASDVLVDSEMINGNKTLAAADADRSFDISIFNPPKESAPPNFLKFRTENLTTLLDSDSFDALILCLSSTDSVNRSQAFTTVQHFMIRLMESVYPEKDRIYLVLGELVETCNDRKLPLDQHPATFIITTFAVHAIRVIRDPTHALYSKMCNFLTDRPRWISAKLVRHFLKVTLTEVPTEDSDAAPWKERMWLLGWIFDGLRTAQDGECASRAGMWEQLGALGSHTSLGSSMAHGELDEPAGGRLQNKIRGRIVNIFGRALCVGMAADLGTQAGGLAWMTIWENREWVDAKIAKSFKRAIASEKRVQDWSFGTVTPEKYV